MTTATDWTCPCRAVNSHASVWCEACGDERPGRAAQGLAAVPKPAEGYAPWKAPTHPPQQLGDDELIRAEMARARTLLGMPPKSQSDADTEKAPRLGLAIDPAIRAQLERAGPEPVGAVLRRRA